MSSKATKIVVSVIAIAVVLILLWYAGKGGNLPNTNTAGSINKDVSKLPQADGKSEVNLTSTSDESFSADMASVDASLSALDKDGSAVDAGLNDKPVSQTE